MREKEAIFHVSENCDATGWIEGTCAQHGAWSGEIVVDGRDVEAGKDEEIMAFSVVGQFR